MRKWPISVRWLLASLGGSTTLIKPNGVGELLFTMFVGVAGQRRTVTLNGYKVWHFVKRGHV
jgi:hypothetical protein